MQVSGSESAKAQTIACTNGGVVATALDVTIPFTGYVVITQTACTCSVGTLPSGVTLKTNTAATVSAAGSVVLTFAANGTLGGASVMNGTIDLTFTISGKTVVKKFGWTKSNKGSNGDNGKNAVVFSVYAPNGTVVINQSGSLQLATAAYSGASSITGTYQWAKYTNGTWTNISGATASTLTVSGADIVNIQSYRCTMTYSGKTYVDVITVEDKSDPYVSEMLSIGGFTVKNNLGGVVPYVIVRTNQKEVDPLLGPISETAPSSPKSGDYWYKIDHTNQTVTLMDYAGSSWAECPETQSLTYTWYKQDKDGKETTFGKTGKVIYLSAAEIELIGVDDKEYILRNAIDQVKDQYDFVIIDCPPSLSMLTINAMTTADSVIVPIQCEYYALEGLSQLIHTIDLVKDRLNNDLEIEGVVFTMYDARTNLSLQVVENVKENLQQNIYKTIIPRNVRLAEAPSYGQPITLYDPRSTGAEAYRLLAEEVINREVE